MLEDLRWTLYRAGALVQPLTAATVLGAAQVAGQAAIGDDWLVKAAQGVALIFLVYSFAKHLLKNTKIIALLKWVGLPVAVHPQGIDLAADARVTVTGVDGSTLVVEAVEQVSAIS